jgi:hypothetical protein
MKRRVPLVEDQEAFRDFVHCRFADAGRLGVAAVPHGRHPQTFTVSDIARVGSATVNTVELAAIHAPCQLPLCVTEQENGSRTHAEAGETLAHTVAKTRRVR